MGAFDLVPIRSAGRSLKNGGTGSAAEAGPGLLSFVQRQAAELYGRAYVGSKSETNAKRRLSSGDVLRHARALLTPEEAVVLDHVAGIGRTPLELATRAKCSEAKIINLYLSAATKLADHFERGGE